MIEQFANNYETLLDGAIDNVVTTLDVVSATGAPSSGQFRLRIDSEIMLVTGVSGVTFTVTRGVEGTAAANHLDGTAVQLVLTKGALDQKRIDDVGAGVFASVPTPGVEGRLYLPSDAGVIMRDNGSTHTHYGPLYELSPVPSTGWTWQNQSSATITTTNLGQLLVAAPGSPISGLSCRVRTMAVAPSPTHLIAGFIPHVTDTYSYCGIIIRQSSSGQLMMLLIGFINGLFHIEAIRHANAATYTGTSLAQIRPQCFGNVIWMKIEYDGTNIILSLSLDKIYWQPVLTEAKTGTYSSGHPDEFGIAVGLAGNNVGAAMHVISWEEY